MKESQLNEDNFAKSKQSMTIEGWVARNRDNYIFVHDVKPEREYPLCYWDGIGYIFELPTDSFPDLKWEDEPRKVRIKIEEI